MVLSMLHLTVMVNTVTAIQQASWIPLCLFPRCARKCTALDYAIYCTYVNSHLHLPFCTFCAAWDPMASSVQALMQGSVCVDSVGVGRK